MQKKCAIFSQISTANAPNAAVSLKLGTAIFLYLTKKGFEKDVPNEIRQK